MLLPCEDNYLRNSTQDRYAPRIGRYDQLPVDIDRALTAVIENELALQRRIDDLKQDLALRYDYTASRAYDTIDRYGDRVINTSNLRSFLASQGTHLLENELIQIIRRIDTDGDMTADFNEFAGFLPAPRYAPSSSPSKASPVKESSASPLRSSSPVRASPAKESPAKESPRARSASPVRSYSPPRYPLPYYYDPYYLYPSRYYLDPLYRPYYSSYYYRDFYARYGYYPRYPYYGCYC